jgi:cellulose synthase/poly-beta-1,6-N-acetylglucosamine synthase-like glycosyltransferase
MHIIQLILNILEIVSFIYLAMAAVYILVFGFASLFPHREKQIKGTHERRIAVLIPGYKEDSVIIDVAKDALNQSYPSDLYDVVIIADSFEKATLDDLKKLPVKLVEVSFDISTKSKALNKAMQTIGDNYDVALVLDADNLMKQDFVERINFAFDNGYTVVQGHRVAKNQNTSFAILDAISEEVNNAIFRKGHRVLGFSSALIGSGMAFDYTFFKETMSNVKAVGGFDKELELKLLRDRVKIEYLSNAIVLDEKVQKAEVFANQRRRWLSAQFVYFRRFFFSGLYHLFFKGNFDFFDKVIQMIQPPRVILLGVVTIFTLFVYLLEIVGFTLLYFPGIQWLTILIITYLAFLMSIPRSFYNRKTFMAVLTLPKAFFIMILSLLKLKGANKKFIHTTHGTDK